MKYSVVDIGSNTVKLVIYNVESEIKPVLREVRHCKLVSYLENGIMSDKGIDILCETLNEFKAISDFSGADEFHAFATASLRKTENRDFVMEKVLSECGVEISLLSGETEAYCSFVGAISNMNTAKGQGLVFDMGGGSTEIIQYNDKKIEKKKSYNIGALSLNIDFAKGDYPNKDSLNATYEYICSLKAENEFSKFKESVCAAGTAINLLAVYNAFFNMKDNSVIYTDRLKKMLEEYKSGNEHLKGLISKLSPQREKTLPMGLAAYCGFFDCLEIEKSIVVKTGVREGYLTEFLLKGRNKND